MVCISYIYTFRHMLTNPPPPPTHTYTHTHTHRHACRQVRKADACTCRRAYTQSIRTGRLLPGDHCLCTEPCHLLQRQNPGCQKCLHNYWHYWHAENRTSTPKCCVVACGGRRQLQVLGGEGGYALIVHCATPGHSSGGGQVGAIWRGGEGMFRGG